MNQTQGPSFTGQRRQRKTRASVRVYDVLARLCITIGGIGTILSVVTVSVFLVMVVWPLFQGAQINDEQHVTPAWEQTARPLHLAIDEYQVMGWVMQQDGSITVFRLDTGEALTQFHVAEPGGPKLTAASFNVGSDQIALGYDDGTVRLGRVQFQTQFLDPNALPETVRSIKHGQAAAFNAGMVQLTPEDQFRQQSVVVELNDPIAVSDVGQPITLLAHRFRSTGPVFCAMTADGEIRVHSVRQRRNLLTGKTTFNVTSGQVPYERPASQSEPPRYMRLSGLGDRIFLAWTDGTLQRFAARDPRDVTLVEANVDVTPQANVELTALQFMVGGTTLLTGDAQGYVTSWDVKHADDAATSDGAILTQTHRFKLDHGVVAIGPSPISRIMAIADAAGAVDLYYLTSDNLLGQVQVDTDDANPGTIQHVFVSPKEDGFTALTENALLHWDFDPRYPEINFRSLFMPVWYEGYPAPVHSWQSTGGTDEFEPKFGLMPLIFGTIKATAYAMIFAVPLALLAAIYTSEFLHPKVRSHIKPTIELMATLPSVVLGFLAGLVIAPFIESVVPATIALIFVVPFVLLTAAYLWQLLPHRTILVLQQIGVDNRAPRELGGRLKWMAGRCLFYLGGVRLMAVMLSVLAAIALSMFVGPMIQALLFAGDIKGWLAWNPDAPHTGQDHLANPFGGWLLLLLPLAAVVAVLLINRMITPMLRQRASEKHWTRQQFAVADFAKFGFGFALTIAIAATISLMMSVLGFDPRGSFHIWGVELSPYGTYVQRNALIVGFAMGFAIIPIIYTIAEDALSTVPGHLRSASLGAGATPWQTAVRIVIPTAMSGLFSACMIGLGRAVGETMIVLMAAGNTPIMEMNIFNGFRTLSANIAVEMPEAVKGSSHYRTLFLAALVLFMMTFVLNTIAEAVRLRFRRRFGQL